MMTTEGVLEEPFLDALCQQAVGVSVYLTNGIKLQGRIEAYDHKALLLESKTRQMIFKHAIATVVPGPEFKWGPEAAYPE